MHWSEILIIVLVAAFFIFLAFHIAYNKKHGITDCDCGKGKGKALVKDFYQNKNKSK